MGPGKLPPGGLPPERLFPTLKHPLTLTQGDILGGSLPRANFPITDNSMSLLRMLIKKKAKENSVSRNCSINVFRKYRKNRIYLELSYTRRIFKPFIRVIFENES